jgi:hypothetical protein
LFFSNGLFFSVFNLSNSLFCKSFFIFRSSCFHFFDCL